MWTHRSAPALIAAMRLPLSPMPICNDAGRYNVINEMLKREPNARVVSFFDIENAPALSVVTIEEMAYGVAWRPSAKLQTTFDRIVDTWPHILPITSEIAAGAGLLRRQLQQRGHTRTAADMLIAATALTHRIPLVHPQRR